MSSGVFVPAAVPSGSGPGGSGPGPTASSGPSSQEGEQVSASFRQHVVSVDRALQRLLDKLAPHQLYRWLGLAVLMSIFILRMILIQGFYIVTYVLFIFILNQFILFLQPKDRASLIAARAAASASDADGASSGGTGSGNDNSAPSALPTLDAEEFRPFVRRLPEFHFWYSSTIATFFSLWATFFPIFDVPVYWPVLVFYFVVLFIATMRRQWLDMRQLKYVPWDIGSKKTYKSDPKRVSVKPRDPASAARAAMDSGGASSTASTLGGATAGAAAPLAPVPTVKRAPAAGARQSVS